MKSLHVTFFGRVKRSRRRRHRAARARLWTDADLTRSLQRGRVPSCTTIVQRGPLQSERIIPSTQSQALLRESRKCNEGSRVDRGISRLRSYNEIYKK